MKRKILVFGFHGGVHSREFFRETETPAFGSFPEEIGRQLHSLGFEVFYLNGWLDRLPLSVQEDAFVIIEKCLSQFKSTALKQTSKEQNLNETVQLYLHPGVGVWADRPELILIAQDMGIQVLAPPAKVLALFANKLTLLGEAEKLGLQNLLISPEPISGVREIEQLLTTNHQSLPIVLRSAKGEGGFAQQVIHDQRDIETKVSVWMEQLRRSVGEVILFAERYLEGARKLTFPFVRFRSGEVRIFPYVDISLQCRYRKVVSFCSASGANVGVDSAIEAQAQYWIEKLTSHIGFVGLGSFEFLTDGSRLFLIGGKPRLDKGFLLWQKVAGTQAVAWQFEAHAANSIKEVNLSTLIRSEANEKWNFGVSLQIWAEDSILQLPQPGAVQEVIDKRVWDFTNAYAELDLVVQEGKSVNPEGLGWIGTLLVGAQDRKQALKVCRGVLEESWIAGSLQTNERFLFELISHPWIQQGIYHAGFVDEEFIPSLRPSHEILQIFVSVIQTIPQLDQYFDEEDNKGTVRWAVGDQWIKPYSESLEWDQSPRFWEVEWSQSLQLTQIRKKLPGISGVLRLPDGVKQKVCAYPIGPGKWKVRIGLWVLLVRRLCVKSGERQKLKPKVSSLVAGRVHAILFREGSVIPAHEHFLMMESLGTLVPHALPVDVRIHRWLVSAEDRIPAGFDLAEFEVLGKPC